MNTTLDTYRWLTQNGFRPLVLMPRTKAASGNWTDANAPIPAPSIFEDSDKNIGCLLGVGGLLDVDLDCPEAVELAPFFMPKPLAAFGRKSTGTSHYLYVVEGLDGSFRIEAPRDPVISKTAKPVLEIRGHGHQTMFPGSTHPSGELIEWKQPPSTTPDRVLFEDLRLACRKLAAAVLTVRHILIDGQRHDTSVYLAGMLYHFEWEEAEADNFITRCLEYTGSKDSAHRRAAKDAYRKGLSGKPIGGGPKLKTYVAAGVVDCFYNWFGSQVQQAVDELNEIYSVVNVNGKLRVAGPDVDDFGHKSFVYYAKDDFKDFGFGGKVQIVNEKGEPKEVSKSSLWFHSPRRRQLEGVVFDPGGKVTDRDDNLFNMWVGWPVDLRDPRSEDDLPRFLAESEAGCSAWIELLRDTVCGGDERTYKWCLDWFTDIVRNPKHKPGTALGIRGEQGAGKSSLADFFAKVIGSAYLQVTNNKHLVGQFNEHLARTLLVHSEEAIFPGDRQHAGILKSIITDRSVIYEPKGINAKMIRSFSRILLTSNSARLAPVEQGDRRYTIIEMGNRKMSPALIKLFHEQMAGDGPTSLMAYLRYRPDFDAAHIKKNLKSAAHWTAASLNLEAIPAWWFSCLENGFWTPLDDPEWSSWNYIKPRHVGWPDTFSTMAFFEAFRKHCSGDYDTRRMNVFMNTMLGLLPKGLDKRATYFMVDKRREQPTAFRNFPPIEECREAFRVAMGAERIEWSSLDAGEDESPSLRVVGGSESEDVPEY